MLNDNVLLVGGHGAIVLLTVSAISHIVWFTAAPLWAFLIIVLEVTIIYQLTVRWEQQARWD